MTRPRSAAAGRDVVHQLALVEVQDPAGALGGQGVVGDHDDRLVELAVELLEQLEDLAGAGAVEVAGGLVGDEQVGVGHDRPRDRHALLLAARELPGIVVLAALQADDPQRRQHVLAPSAARQVGQQSSGSSTFSKAVSTGIRL